MQIVILGTGNVATVLGRKMILADHDVVQVYGRKAGPAQELATTCYAAWTTDLQTIDTTADLYIIAVTDTAIPGIASQLRLDKKLVVHTAGSVPKKVLQPTSRNYGVLYPLQSLRKEMTSLPEIPFLVDGNTEDDLTLIHDFACTLSGQVQVANDAQRLTLHVAAVVVSNFTNHLYTLAEQYCQREGTDFKLLLPLITEVALRLQQVSPSATQTGPAIRHDALTIGKHLDLLNGHPALQEIYALFTKSIQQQYP